MVLRTIGTLILIFALAYEFVELVFYKKFSLETKIRNTAIVISALAIAMVCSFLGGLLLMANLNLASFVISLFTLAIAAIWLLCKTLTIGTLISTKIKKEKEAEQKSVD